MTKADDKLDLDVSAPDSKSLVESFQNPDVRRVAGRLVDAAKQGGAAVASRKSSLVIRVKCQAWEQPVTVA